MINVTEIPPCPVDLQDGQQVLTTKQGQVVISPQLTLDHVFFVPSLQCHLILISQLTMELGFIVYFTNSLCAKQVQHSGNLIGAGGQKGGLYYFRRVPTMCVVSSISSRTTFELWHRHLVHSSDRVLKSISIVKNSRSSIGNKLPRACIVCPQAKQTRRDFLLVIVRLLVCLNLSIVICGGRILHPLLVGLIIF